MENKSEILDDVYFDKGSGVERQYVFGAWKFIFLSVITFGLYHIWWFYTSWRFFKQKDKLDISPVPRALFSIFFMVELLDKILKYARKHGYAGNYSSWGLFVGFFILNLLSRLPEPFWLVSIFSFVFLIEPFNALLYAKQNSGEFEVVDKSSLSAGEIIAVILGGILWLLILLGLFVGEQI
ncbi:MAG: DUF4234 domain-containing protein [Cytophagaceae bacterium]